MCHADQRWTDALPTVLLSIRTACKEDLQAFLSELVCGGEQIHWVQTAHYLGVTLDTRLTWSPHVNQLRRKTAQRLDMLGPLRKRRSFLSDRNGVLLYKQLIRPMMDYACPIWRSGACSLVRKLQVLQSKCLRVAINAPWYVGGRQIHEDLGIPFFADHIRALPEIFDSKLADAGNPLVRQL
jgi:hypothetical protein